MAVVLVGALLGLGLSTSRAHAAGRVLFILDASGSMGAISADGRSRFEHSKDQVRAQAAQFGAQGYEMGMYIFSHRFPSCDDIELKVPMSSAGWGAESSIQNALIPLSPHGPTPLTKTIQEAAKYIKDNHMFGTEVIVVSDGGDTCGGDPVQAAKDLYAATQSKISIIGMDMNAHDAAEMAGVARAGNGSFRSEFTGTASGGQSGWAALFQPQAAPALPRPRSLSPSRSPGSYSRGNNPPQAPKLDPAQEQGHGREGAPDDSKPIVDPNSIPRVVSFDKDPPPPESPKMPLAAAQAPPKPPAPNPKPTEAPPELETSKPMLL